MLIGLGGCSGAGKDTCAGYLVDAGWKQLSFGDEIRKVATYCFPWLPEEWPVYEDKDRPFIHPRNVNNLTPRDIWKILDVGKTVDPIWLATKALYKANEYLADGYDVVISDVRQPHEAKEIKDNGGWLFNIYSNFQKRSDSGDNLIDLIKWDFKFKNTTDKNNKLLFMDFLLYKYRRIQ